ncbi:unnamed protein product [Urochloa humidicola]
MLEKHKERLMMAISVLKFALDKSTMLLIITISLLHKRQVWKLVLAISVLKFQTLQESAKLLIIIAYDEAVALFHSSSAIILSCPRSVLVNQIKRIDRTGRDICTAIIIHCTPADEIVEQQKRCSDYSQQAIGFAISTFSGYMVSESFSTRDTTIKVAMAAFFVAITADLLSLRMKPKWGRALVYISSFHLLLMTFLVFISFDKDYGYAILFVPLTIAATLLRRNLWQQSVNNVVSQDHLDFMFNLSTLIVNWDITTVIIAISGPNKHIEATATGFLFFCTIVLGLYLMMVATVRTVALTVHAKYLDVLLMVLLVSTLASTSITFIYFLDEAMEGELVPT